VAAFVDRGTDVNCKGTPPALIIHGVTDRAGNFGQSVAEMFAKRNGCAATAPAGLAMARTDLMAAFTAPISITRSSFYYYGIHKVRVNEDFP
jgi:hypothetical protein